jgi:hypothetical protein
MLVWCYYPVITCSMQNILLYIFVYMLFSFSNYVPHWYVHFYALGLAECVSLLPWAFRFYSYIFTGYVCCCLAQRSCNDRNVVLHVSMCHSYVSYPYWFYKCNISLGYLNVTCFPVFIMVCFPHAVTVEAIETSKGNATIEERVFAFRCWVTKHRWIRRLGITWLAFSVVSSATVALQ